MKIAINSLVFTFALLWTVSAFGQGTCHNGGGGYPNTQPGLPYPNQTYPGADPYASGATNPNYSNQLPIANLAPSPALAAAPAVAPAATVAVAAPARPTARITVISANAALATNSMPSTGSAKLTIVADEPAVDERIVKLAGSWKAVARRGEGELTTVELHMDNRGWAELTVPGTDGKPSTSKSRINLEDEELKLTVADKVVSLGKLVDFNARQMVLERADGQVTFVRL